MDGEGSPLGGTGVEVVVVNVKVARAHRLRSETIKQGHFGPTRNANCEVESNYFRNYNL